MSHLQSQLNVIKRELIQLELQAVSATIKDNEPQLQQAVEVVEELTKKVKIEIAKAEKKLNKPSE